MPQLDFQLETWEIESVLREMPGADAAQIADELGCTEIEVVELLTELNQVEA